MIVRKLAAPANRQIRCLQRRRNLIISKKWIVAYKRSQLWRCNFQKTFPCRRDDLDLSGLDIENEIDWLSITLALIVTGQKGNSAKQGNKIWILNSFVR